MVAGAELELDDITGGGGYDVGDEGVLGAADYYWDDTGKPDG